MNYILFLVLFSLNAFALEVPPLTSPVMDLANVLDEREKTELSQNIRNIWEEDKLIQISILIVPTLGDEVLEEYSIKVAEKWQLGTKDKDNGLLILLAMEERKIRIEVGNGIEGVITDAKSRRMIDGMKSYMRSSNYFYALNEVVSTLKKEMLANTPEALEKARLDSEEEKRMLAASMKRFKENLFNGVIIILTIVVAFGFFYNIGQFFVLPKKMALMKQKNDNMVKKQVMLDNDINENLSKLDKTKEDPHKRYCHNLSSLNSRLVNDKQRLLSSIVKMKEYLGVK